MTDRPTVEAVAILPAWRQDAIMAALRDPNPQVGEAAITWLADAADVSFGPVQEKQLSEFLRDHLDKTSDLLLLKSMLRAVHLINGAILAPQVAELLKSSDNEVRKSAAFALASMGTNGASFAPQVAELLESSDNEVRKSAAYNLARMGTNGLKFSAQVAELLKSSDDTVRVSAVCALGNMGIDGASFAPQLAEFLKTWRHSRISRISAAEALGAMGSNGARIAPQVAEFLKSSDNRICASAIEVLGDMGTNGANFAPQVAELLKSSDDQIRSVAVQALGKMGTNGAIFALQVAEFLNSSDNEVCESAVDVLGNMGTNGAIFAPKIAKLLKSDDENTICSATRALGKMGVEGPRFAPQIAELLRNSSGRVCRTSAQVLGEMGSNSIPFAPQIIELLKSSDYQLSATAARALGNICTNGANFVPQIAELLKSSDNIRRAAAYALGSMGTNGAVYAPQVAALLKSDDDTRRTAAFALGNMGTNGAIYAPQVAELLRSSNEFVRRAAAYALGSMGTNGAVYASQIAELLGSNNDLVHRSVIDALAQMGSHVESVPSQVSESFKSLSSQIRRSGLQALADMGTNAARVTMQVAELLKDPDEDVRRDAGKLIVRLIGKPNLDISLRLIEETHGYADRRSDLVFWAYMIGGTSETNFNPILWLSNRERVFLKNVKKLNEIQVLPLFGEFSDIFASAESLRSVRNQLVDLVVDWTRERQDFAPDIKKLLGKLRDQFSKDYPGQSRIIDDALDGNKQRQQFYKILLLACGHVGFWMLLIFVYPRSSMVQAVFFWNKWIRRMFGLGYVGLAITLIPPLRRRLFEPFRESLIPRRFVDGFDTGAYFQESEVIEIKGSRPGNRESLAKTIGNVKGQIVLEGQSGLGKTSLLQHLAQNSRRILVFLRATDCKEGVMTAIQKRLQGQAKDETYLRTLIYAGALDVLIDGLNEASPETRAKISQFVEEHFKGNFILTTQPMLWSPPAISRLFRLQPLRGDQIKNFMFQQWSSVETLAKLTKEEYEKAVTAYLAESLPPTEADSTADARFAVLSNPMEASLAAELLAQGEKPDLYRLVAQRFHRMAESFRENHGRTFPIDSFAERVYEWRKSDRADISIEGFELEAAELSPHRLMIERMDTIKKPEEEKARIRWFFRHDRIMEFFLLPAFIGEKNEKRRFDDIEDERFWGVYELLAVRLPKADEIKLYESLNERAADKGQNDLRNRYQVARRRRAI